MEQILTVTTGMVDWARAQFALTAIYHWLFVPLTLGLAVIMGIFETIYYRKRTAFWLSATKFWQRLFGINFAMGVATGIILEFEFGTNWSNYSWFVGDIFGAPLAIEGIVAFFMESTFVAVMFFGWQKVSPGFHLTSTWLTGLGATISAWWILVANAWMQYPVGCEFNPDTMRNEMTSFTDVALSPFAVNKFSHTVTSAWIIGAIFVVAVSCYYLYKNRHRELSVQSLKIGSIVGLIACALAIHSGDQSAYQIAQVQPMKLAAMEALYNGSEGQGLTLIAPINPVAQPDYTKEPAFRLEVPSVLSFLATHDFNGFVPGVNDVIKGGYVNADGYAEPSFADKQRMGGAAILALKEYRSIKAHELTAKLTPQQQDRKLYLAQSLKQNMKYFGYGYVKEPAQTVPAIPVCFYAFRIMVGLGTLFLLFFAVSLYLIYKQRLINSKIKWFYIVGMALLPLGYICSESGWVLAEFGRQPWTIQDMMPTWIAVSNVQTSGVVLTFFIFLILFTTLLTVELSILWKQIKKGPDEESSMEIK